MTAAQCRQLAANLQAEERLREPLEPVIRRTIGWYVLRHGWFGRLRLLVDCLRARELDYATLLRRHIRPQEDRTLAQLRLLSTALAIRAFREEEGLWPATLDELLPKYLFALPIDPFNDDGQPLRYRVDDEGFTLYSFGPDRIDDGGELVSWNELFSRGDLMVDISMRSARVDEENAAKQARDKFKLDEAYKAEAAGRNDDNTEVAPPLPPDAAGGLE